MIFPIHQIQNLVQGLQKLVQNWTHHASPCTTSIYTYTHDTIVGIGKKNHHTEPEKFAGTFSLQKNKSKLLYDCIIITLEYFNSFTIGHNTHIKKIL